MKHNELKACPFCGGEATVVILTLSDREETKEPYVICKTCHAMSAWYMSREDAINAWNRRANDET